MNTVESQKRAAELLRGPDGERLYLLLVNYSSKVARRYGWRTGKILPQGMAPDAIATDVMIKVLQGDRIWDERKEPSLLNALKGMVRSDIGHLYGESETQRVESIVKIWPDGRERTADDFASPDPNPEDITIRAERAQLEMIALDLIRSEVEGKPELESVFLALYESSDLGEVARNCGLPIERIYSLRRELDRIAERITPARVARVLKERKIS